MKNTTVVVATVAAVSCVYRREFEIGTANSIPSVLPVSQYLSHLIKIENARQKKRTQESEHAK